MTPDVNPDPELDLETDADPIPEMEPDSEPDPRIATDSESMGDPTPNAERTLDMSRSETGDRQAINILLVEDDTVDVMNVERAFEKSNIINPVYVAENGAEALGMLRTGGVPLDRLLILLDLNMPRMNGIEFLRELRDDEELAHLPVVVLTTSNSERDRIEAYNLNVAGYIVKPVTFLNFVEAMKTLNNYWTLVEMP